MIAWKRIAWNRWGRAENRFGPLLAKRVRIVERDGGFYCILEVSRWETPEEIGPYADYIRALAAAARRFGQIEIVRESECREYRRKDY